MSLGWDTMSGAAINIIVAPWFERRRGLTLSWALNGGSAGGVVIAPLLVLAISRLGFAAGLDTAAAVMLAVLIPVAVLVLRPRRPDEHDPADLRSGLDSPPTPPRRRLVRSQSFASRQCCAPAPSLRPRSHSRSPWLHRSGFLLNRSHFC